MKLILSLLTSMKTMAVLMLIFAVAVGYATFIENDYGTVTAKAEVYNARWFEVLLIALSFNLAYNIYRFRMWRKGKRLVMLFHLSFLVILFGAAVTRYTGFEGMMHIREGNVANTLVSTDTYLTIAWDSGEGMRRFKERLLLSKWGGNTLDATFDVDGQSVKVRLIEHIPNAVDAIVAAPDGKPMVQMMVVGGASAPEQIRLARGEVYENEGLRIDFDSGRPLGTDKPQIRLYALDGALKMEHNTTLRTLRMADQSSGELPPSVASEASTRMLFSLQSGASFVIREYLPQAKRTVKSGADSAGPMQQGSEMDGLRLTLGSGEEHKEILLMGMPGVVGTPKLLKIGGKRLMLTYGAEPIKLPFGLKLVDFQLERYPGSQSPASYASEVMLIDNDRGINAPFRIYMNHVLDHRGYRFFQSSYDRDEMGTVLSVNHDPGTLPTYIGYLMLAIGIFGSLFVPGGRFRKLGAIAKKAADEKAKLVTVIATLVAVTLATPVRADIIDEILNFDVRHAEQFGQLVVQDSGGRMKPLDTLSTEILHKLNRSSSIEVGDVKLTPNQIVLGMMINPEAWREIRMIRTGHKEVNRLLGLDPKAKRAAFSQFFEYPDELAGYKLARYVDEAIRKAPGKRDKFDKAVLQVDERVNVAYMVYNGSLVRIWPKPNDANNKWLATIEALQQLPQSEGLVIRALAVAYFAGIEEAQKSGDWSAADEALQKIATYQRHEGAQVYPDATRIEMEIRYNHYKIFERLWPFYFIVGFVLLILAFLHIITPSFRLGAVARGAYGLLILFFLFHTVGLALRWYISGHAPWSNGFESMIYIGWATVLAGFLFSRNSPITLAATSILAGLILFVAHLSWMDPQVTNLVPVLHSYWLSIHVSMITASYGFLGLGALLGFITLILFLFNRGPRAYGISLSIKELNAINEMSLLVGLAMLTVGNFLGGVWANESWGRYWGWDPKETWALVTILIYAVVLHLRFMKALYTPFLFSAISLLAFTSVLMTYFGVNYYLAGLHSYAKGDPVPIPEFVPWSYGIIAVVIFFAWFRRRLVEQPVAASEPEAVKPKVEAVEAVMRDAKHYTFVIDGKKFGVQIRKDA